MTPQEQSELDEILREVTGEFAAQYRLRNEAKEPYSIKIAENKAEAAIDEAKTALLAWRTKAIAEARNDQTFKVIQALVKIDAISDRAATIVLATYTAPTPGDKENV